MKDIAKQAIKALNQKDEDLNEGSRTSLRWGRIIAILFIVLMVVGGIVMTQREPREPNEPEVVTTTTIHNELEAGQSGYSNEIQISY